MLRESCTTYIFERRLHLAGLDVLPAQQSHGVVEEQVTLGLAAAHQQHGILVVLMLAREPRVVHVVQYVYIVNQDGLVVAEEALRLLQSPTGLQQLRRLVAEVHQRGIVLLGDVVQNLLGKVVDVDHETVVALGLQPADVDIEQRRASDGHQRLGHGVGEGLQAGTEARCQYHRLFHTFCFGLQRYKKNRN